MSWVKYLILLSSFNLLKLFPKAKRAESFERRRVEAEERAVRAREREADARYREADARYRDSLTNRDRYLDEGGKRYRPEDYIW